jgi:hypothetical protein
MLSAGGLIGVKLPPGRQTIAIRYSDRSDVGAVITLLTCLGAVLLISRR